MWGEQRGCRNSIADVLGLPPSLVPLLKPPLTLVYILTPTHIRGGHLSLDLKVRGV